ncbi:hypothetical protein ILUMI_19382 [Ignelater luminosus]|uniref:Cytochrome P450 n=1 Tax=Ignelater luminosus TaxID=2038154 RepID=A0A8K0CJF2_IGNLU|nr:hypothetical protein ILUMI_19382 [Ignelater luminosus]
MQILIDLKNNAKAEAKEDIGKSDDKSLTVEKIAAQAFELALNSEVQDKLREEISKTFERYEQNITYEGVMQMKYLDPVVDETLRKYPPISVIPRVSEENYQIPNTEVIINKGTRVLISVLGLHHDPEYYPSPDTFDPERFNEENKKSIPPFTYIQFGERPRVCIGRI